MPLTGDALPDLPKLMALADALKVSMDALCGRKIPSAPPTPEKEAAPSKSRLPRRIANFALIVFLTVGSFFAGTRFADTTELKEVLTPSLPETFSVSGERFYVDSGNLFYQFVPGITGEAYTYQITFTGMNSPPQTLTAPYSGGICTGSADLSEHDFYSVLIIVSNAQDSRAVAIASDLNFSRTSGHAQWIPIE